VKEAIFPPKRGSRHPDLSIKRTGRKAAAAGVTEQLKKMTPNQEFHVDFDPYVEILVDRHTRPIKMAKKDPRLSHQTLRVMSVFIERPKDSLAGSDIWKQTGMLSGTLYPILMRLERAGWLKSRWEVLETSEAGRPRKRLYSLTGVGYNKTRNALGELGVPSGSPIWNS
jgi:PadR family transcriptional regulator PadR